MTEEKKIAHVAVASFDDNVIPGMDMWSSGQDKSYLDKFEFPKDYFKVIKLCNHYYRTDPIVSNTINKILDIGMKDYSVQQRNCTDEEYRVYASINDNIMWHLRELALEYLLSGLLVPEVVWGEKTGKEIHPDLPPEKTYEVPINLWKRDPETLKLRKTPIPNRVMVSVEPSDEDVEFIRNNGVYSDGTKDKETWRLLWENYRAYVLAVKRGVTVFPLENPFVIRRNPLPDNPYPTPYLIPVLQALEHKRNLRKMDYAIAARVISAIMLIKIGNDDFPLLEDDDDIVTEIRKQFRYRYAGGNIERLFQLFTNHTVDISWIMPDVKALLDESKYEAVNLDILFGLGFPRIILTGETARSATSQAEFALLSPAETIKSVRNSLLPWVDYLYEEMKDRNNFTNLPSAAFSEVRLYDLSKLLEVADKVYERGALSKTTLARLAGFDFENAELPQRVKEQEWFKKLDIDEYPAMPFDRADSPNASPNSEPSNNNQE